MHDDGKSGGRQPLVEGAEIGRQQTHARADIEPEPALAQVDAAEVSVNEYLQARIEEAVVHLRRLLPAEELELLKQQLMDQMCTDPTMSELVARAAGVSLTACAEKE